MQQPDLSGALFANLSKDKDWEICKKAGTEGGKAAIKNHKLLLALSNCRQNKKPMTESLVFILFLFIYLKQVHHTNQIPLRK